MKRLCFVVATDATVKAFLLDQLRTLGREYALTVVANTDDANLLAANGIEGELVRVRIERKISLGRDLAALAKLWKLFRRRELDAVHSVTPKAGLLAMLASAAARVPVRTHTFTGQVWATRTGPMRGLLKTMDRLIAFGATRLLADSASQRQFLVDEGIVRADRISVLGAGSISGVDLARFKPDSEARAAVRADLGIPGDATVFLFIGRLNRDKGVLDLAAAFNVLASGDATAHLVFVGPDEEQLVPVLRERVAAFDGRCHFVGYTRQPERFMAAADVFCLPSYREGFGSVIIEAAAVGIPSVASRIYGITDAVVDGETGFLHAPGDVAEIATAMSRLSTEAGLRRAQGDRAHARAKAEFATGRLTGEVLRYYSAALAGGSRNRQSKWAGVAKMAMDRTVAGGLLVLTSPLLAGVALAIRTRMGSPVFFTQERPGIHGHPFRVVKFRTMRDAVDSDGRPRPDAERLTALGRFLRAASIDELPQLWNVLTGDLSLVGPRPLLMQYLSRYSAEQARRHDVLPGITGWAQVNGRNAISWDEKFALDVWYVDNWSFWLDLKILALTAAKVLRRSGISREGHATMPEFMGSATSETEEPK